jgi:hypothetical protein
LLTSKENVKQKSGIIKAVLRQDILSPTGDLLDERKDADCLIAYPERVSN